MDENFEVLKVEIMDLEMGGSGIELGLGSEALYYLTYTVFAVVNT